MRYHNVSDPVYAPNSKGGPKADTEHYGEPAGWHTHRDMVHAAYTLHAEDDDWDQAGTKVREVLSDAARERLVNNIVGHLRNGVTEPVLQLAFEYWHNVDTELGSAVEQALGYLDRRAADARLSRSNNQIYRVGCSASANNPDRR